MDKNNEIKEITCDVTSCIYNKESSKCYAGSINVGTHDATSCSQTICATYAPKHVDNMTAARDNMF